MIPANHTRLCDDLRRTWTKKDGAVAIMTTPGRKTKLRVCVSGQSNGLRAYTCVIWLLGDIIYQGPMESSDMREILTLHGVCRGEVTRAADLNDDAEKRGTCYGMGTAKHCAKCKALRCGNA